MRGTGVAAGLALGGVGLGGCNKQSRKEASEKGDSELIAYCGLNCIKCPIYLATREKNASKQKQMREYIARKIKEVYGVQSSVEDVTDCDGCKTQGGRLYSNCRKCQIRKCASEKGLENCAYCSEYVCEKLSKFFDSEGEQAGAKKRLDEIKARL
ncbi:MAG: DUF3795 domain-containing protein [Sedimentisphaerales bacterium]|jgi:hypothetical protein